MSLFHVLLTAAMVAIPLPGADAEILRDEQDILDNAYGCYLLEQPEILVGSSIPGDCPDPEMVLDAIRYAQVVFGEADVNRVVVVYTHGAFACGGGRSQGCTGYDSEVGADVLYMVVSDIGRGYPSVTAHEFAHVVHIRNGVAPSGDAHTPEIKWEIVNNYRGKN
jgi:hypothetical protein